jgi:hypothetical protein
MVACTSVIWGVQTLGRKYNSTREKRSNMGRMPTTPQWEDIGFYKGTIRTNGRERKANLKVSEFLDLVKLYGKDRYDVLAVSDILPISIYLFTNIFHL